MDQNEEKILSELIILTKSSEIKYRESNFKGAIEDKQKAKKLFKSTFFTKEVKKSYENVLSGIYISKFDLINDHKKRLSENKRKSIIKYLEMKSEQKLEAALCLK